MTLVHSHVILLFSKQKSRLYVNDGFVHFLVTIVYLPSDLVPFAVSMDYINIRKFQVVIFGMKVMNF